MIVCSLLLSACASSPPIAQRDNLDLCRGATLGSLIGKDRESRAEIVKRGLITEGEWELMVDRNIKVGMSECAVLAATYNHDSPFHRVDGAYRFGDDTTKLFSSHFWEGVDGAYRFGDDATLVFDDFDPRVPTALYTNYMRERASEVCYTPYSCYTPYFTPTQQKYVPKYLITLKNGKVIDCKSVDLAKVDTTAASAELFTLPCMKDVPGFNQ